MVALVDCNNDQYHNPTHSGISAAGSQSLRRTIYFATRMKKRTFCRKGNTMITTTISVTGARAKLYKLMDETVSSHKPVVIKGKRGNAVLLSESDWNAISETLHLVSLPGMRESIIECLNAENSECSEKLDW